jgi:hypothetical protein
MSGPHDLSCAVWRKSTHSENANTCVEVARNLPGIVAVRDSVDPNGPALVVTPGEWRRFLAAAKNLAP